MEKSYVHTYLGNVQCDGYLTHSLACLWLYKHFLTWHNYLHDVAIPTTKENASRIVWGRETSRVAIAETKNKQTIR